MQVLFVKVLPLVRVEYQRRCVSFCLEHKKKGALSVCRTEKKNFASFNGMRFWMRVISARRLN